MATRKNVFIFQVYLVWHHTSQCQEVPCSAMIVLAVSVQKKKEEALPLEKRPRTTLSRRPAERWEANQLQVQKGQQCKGWSNKDQT